MANESQEVVSLFFGIQLVKIINKRTEQHIVRVNTFVAMTDVFSNN
jgi:hypothetical protein